MERSATGRVSGCLVVVVVMAGLALLGFLLVPAGLSQLRATSLARHLEDVGVRAQASEAQAFLRHSSGAGRRAGQMDFDEVTAVVDLPDSVAGGARRERVDIAWAHGTTVMVSDTGWQVLPPGGPYAATFDVLVDPEDPAVVMAVVDTQQPYDSRAVAVMAVVTVALLAGAGWLLWAFRGPSPTVGPRRVSAAGDPRALRGTRAPESPDGTARHEEDGTGGERPGQGSRRTVVSACGPGARARSVLRGLLLAAGGVCVVIGLLGSPELFRQVDLHSTAVRLSEVGVVVEGDDVRFKVGGARGGIDEVTVMVDRPERRLELLGAVISTTPAKDPGWWSPSGLSGYEGALKLLVDPAEPGVAMTVGDVDRLVGGEELGGVRDGALAMAGLAAICLSGGGMLRPRGADRRRRRGAPQEHPADGAGIGVTADSGRVERTAPR